MLPDAIKVLCTILTCSMAEERVTLASPRDASNSAGRYFALSDRSRISALREATLAS